MTRFTAPDNFRHDQEPGVGVLVSNLGTPDAPTARALRRYLGEFLADPRVVELPRPLWRLILHGVILRTRPRRSAAAYEKVWTDAGSPLAVHSSLQCEAIARELTPAYRAPVHVELGFRYGQPSIKTAISKLLAAGIDKLIVLPLYPQYSGSTTASTFDEVTRQLQSVRRIPELRFIDSYHDQRLYIDALAASIREHGQQYSATHRLLFSFHGIPRRYLLAGDPYHCQCHKTARLVAERLGLADDSWATSFQSRLGREEWLRPYTDEILTEWATNGVSGVDVICPGFSADCLETLEEVDMQYRELFLGKGGQQFHYIAALNERRDHIDLLAALVTSATSDWQQRHLPDIERARTLERARALGAVS
ncbi:MAG: ferrochelatase [Gammaproteobacteria bacterium]|nr:ferrochelatase [Gammaproteobacteria bacterium]NND59896.1 ferrochelatase [Gammaproteobacteria bacterium]